MAQALRTLGVSILDDGDDWVISPPSRFAGGAVDCGLAGTVMRFVPPLAALASGESRFDGDPHARTRPMDAVISGLRQLGVTVDDDGRGTLPFTVHGLPSLESSGGTVTIDASASSQFVSGLMLAGARFDRGLEIVHAGGVLPSLPHIEMTVETLALAGVSVAQPEPERWIVPSGPIDLPDTVVEPDLSNAAPFLCAALVCGGSVTVPHWPSVTTQAGDQLRGLLAQMGADVTLAGGELTVSSTGRLGPLVADLHDVGELTPVLAALCALADGESRLTGVSHIRGHETDRLSALANELGAVGASVDELPDGLVIRAAGAQSLHAAPWKAYADHRMAQAGALLGLAVAGITIDDITSTTKTMADFPGLWANLLAQTESLGK